MDFKSIFPTYYKVKDSINQYINKNVVAQETRLASSMDVSSVDDTLSKMNNSLKNQDLNQVQDLPLNINGLSASVRFSLVPSWSDTGVVPSKSLITLSEPVDISYDLYDRGNLQGLTVKPDIEGKLSTYACISLNNKKLKPEFLTSAVLGVGPSSTVKLVYSDTSKKNDKIILNAFKNRFQDLVSTDYLKYRNASSLTESNISVNGHYSLLPAQDKKLNETDREFMNSILSLAVYTGNDSWTVPLNEQLANGEQLETNQVLKNNALFPDANDLDKVIAAYYATTFTPAKVMPNGKFEAPMGKSGELGNFEFKDGVYRSNDNVCAASSMLSKNEDGSYTLHMAYRGTDNDSRTSGKFSELEMRYPKIKAFNSLVRFARYCVTAYSDMGRHHENFTPFEKACLEFAANPENNVKNIEVSGHSLGGAMVQRFLKSEALKNSPLKDKVQGVTWGAPQTNANVLGKTLVTGKRVIEAGIVGVRNVAVKSYVEYLTSFNVDVIKHEADPVKSKIAKALFSPLVMANLMVDGTQKAIPNISKFVKNVAGFTYSIGKKCVSSVVDTVNDFEKDVNKSLSEYREDRQRMRVMNGLTDKSSKLQNTVMDMLYFAPDNIAAVASAVPRSIGPITRRIKRIWDDVGEVGDPEKRLRQYAHHKDPIPLITKLLASNVGDKKILENYVDTIPVWQQAVKNWDAELSQKMFQPGNAPEVKKYGMVVGAYKATKIFVSNALGHLSTDKHNMRKYVVNTMMKESLFRRTNIHSDNSRFTAPSENDKNWLANTPNITRFEVLLHSTRLENTIIEDAMKGTQFRDHREIYARPFGYADVNDGVNVVSKHFNSVLNKVEKLYGSTIPCVSKDYDKSADFTNCANETPYITYRKQRTVAEKLRDLKEEQIAQRRNEHLVRSLEKARMDIVSAKENNTPLPKQVLITKADNIEIRGTINSLLNIAYLDKQKNPNESIPGISIHVSNNNYVSLEELKNGPAQIIDTNGLKINKTLIAENHIAEIVGVENKNNKKIT